MQMTSSPLHEALTGPEGETSLNGIRGKRVFEVITFRHPITEYLMTRSPEGFEMQRHPLSPPAIHPSEDTGSIGH